MARPDKHKKWTIVDIADEAGVSAKTVSHVVNGKLGVSEETRSRVLRIIERVGYHPNIGARNLRGTKANCIGIALPAPLEEVPLSEEFFMWLFVRLFRLFASRGEYICFDLTPHRAPVKTDYARGLWEKMYRACVIAGPLACDDSTVKRIHASGEPYLVFGRLDSLPACSCATVDYEQGAYLSAKYLLDRGHRHVAMLKAFAGYQPGAERSRGYERALREAGLEPEERLVQSVSLSRNNIANMVHRLLAHRDVTALIDSSGMEDASALRAGCQRAGRALGKDVEIVPWAYAENGAVVREACGQLWLPVREAASEGLEELAKWVHGERREPCQVVYPPVLRERVPDTELQKPNRMFVSFD
ncbi:MAG: LacI family DNA-binding transcriptional regulator [Candidatus Hydrogenedentes bacterium]|nr:LacI family DNA-binding transcriptional regulator [Candidatus Hydrogenedentota bacterium]